MNLNAYSLVTGQANLIPAHRYIDGWGLMNEQVHIITYDVASMVEFNESVVNFEQKKWFGTTTMI